MRLSALSASARVPPRQDDQVDLGSSGRVRVVTGGSPRLGFAPAKVRIADGACVVLGLPHEAAASSAGVRLPKRAASAKAVAWVVPDDADPAKPDRLVAMARERFGGLDGALIIVGGSPPGTVAMTTDDCHSAVRAGPVPYMRQSRWIRPGRRVFALAGSIVHHTTTEVLWRSPREIVLMTRYERFCPNRGPSEYQKRTCGVSTVPRFACGSWSTPWRGKSHPSGEGVRTVMAESVRLAGEYDAQAARLRHTPATVAEELAGLDLGGSDLSVEDLQVLWIELLVVVDNGPSRTVPTTAQFDNVTINSTTYTFESKASCKDGGWQNLTFSPGPFKNQGDCVSYFASSASNG